MSKSFSSLHSLALAIALGAPLGAQTPAPDPAPISHKDFRSKLFVLKHRNAAAVARSLQSLGSGAKGAEITSHVELGTLSVRDYPENLAAIEEAIKRLDAPGPQAQGVEFHVHVLFASHAGGAEGHYPEELRDVLAALKSTLSYRTYTPVASLVQRGQEGFRGITARGTTEVQAPDYKVTKKTITLPFIFSVDNFKVETPVSGPALIQLSKMVFEFYAAGQEWQTKIASDLTLKAGEKVVVGTSTLKDQGVVVVLSAQLVK